MNKQITKRQAHRPRAGGGECVLQCGTVGVATVKLDSGGFIPQLSHDSI